MSPPQPSKSDSETPTAVSTSNDTPKALPKGVVLGPDGKPCRSCTSFASWSQMVKADTTTSPARAPPSPNPSQPQPQSQLPRGCPPDVEQLGSASWTLLHTLAAQYPSAPSRTTQSDMKTFMGLFGRFYPCWTCAEDFQTWIRVHEPRVSSRDEFGRWMCEAHNAVNGKLGKPLFDCGRWQERWRSGWSDGSCD